MPQIILKCLSCKLHVPEKTVPPTQQTFDAEFVVMGQDKELKGETLKLSMAIPMIPGNLYELYLKGVFAIGREHSCVDPICDMVLGPGVDYLAGINYTKLLCTLEDEKRKE